MLGGLISCKKKGKRCVGRYNTHTQTSMRAVLPLGLFVLFAFFLVCVCVCAFGLPILVAGIFFTPIQLASGLTFKKHSPSLPRRYCSVSARTERLGSACPPAPQGNIDEQTEQDGRRQTVWDFRSPNHAAGTLGPSEMVCFYRFCLALACSFTARRCVCPSRGTTTLMFEDVPFTHLRTNIDATRNMEAYGVKLARRHFCCHGKREQLVGRVLG